ncbi:hypothetical protein MMC20_000438 [Loxospora ochrophaea]|nr:hypothetical protein [Loxospora ochrophaea]
MFSHVDTYRPWYIFPSILAALLSFYSSWPQQLFSATVLKFNPAPTNPHVIHERTRVSYLGTTENGVEQFESIFYAEDTSGPNRFMPPMPYAPPSGTFVDVTALGAACPQGLGPAALPFTSPVTNSASRKARRRQCLSKATSVGLDTWRYVDGQVFNARIEMALML